LELDQRREARQHVRRARQVTVASSAVPVSPAGSSGDSMPEFRPLSFYLNGKQEGAPAGAGDHPLSEMPGMDASMQLALRELGYTSVEQVARWGRADVRAVSALLGVDQRLIESDWVARARRLLSIG
jgi:predicted flap endonuclease-1-like 5' DNA nuclease